RLDRMTRLDPAPQLGADLRSHLGTGRADLEQRPREILCVLAPEAKADGQAAEELVEGNVAGEDGDARGARLVDDLVERLAPLGLRGTEQHVGLGKQARNLVAGDRRLERDPL